VCETPVKSLTNHIAKICFSLRANKFQIRLVENGRNQHVPNYVLFTFRFFAFSTHSKLRSICAHANNVRIAFRVRFKCVSCAFQMCSVCVSNVFRVRFKCVSNAFQLHFKCVPCAFQMCSIRLEFVSVPNSI
jgi:hypothetical protein